MISDDEANIAPWRRASASVEENLRNANTQTTQSLHARSPRSYRTALPAPEWQPTIRRLSQRRPAPRLLGRFVDVLCSMAREDGDPAE